MKFDMEDFSLENLKKQIETSKTSDIRKLLNDDLNLYHLHIIYENKPEEIERLITLWFNSDNSDLHKAGNLIATGLYKNYKHLCSLDKTYINEIPEEDVVFIIKKIIGHNHSFDETICHLIFSALERTSWGELLKNHIIWLFNNYINLQIPGIVQNYFSSRLTNLNNQQTNIANEILEDIKIRLESFKTLPKLKELEVTSFNRNYYKSKLNNSFQKAYKEARKNSVFAQIVKEIQVKGGLSSFTREYRKDNVDNKDDYKIKFHEFSTEMILPSGELYNPIEMFLIRAQCINVKKKK